MKVAIIGAGISGLAAALILNDKFEVHLFESDPRLGGHANTVNVQDNENGNVAVDTGFLVYNTLTYPHFTKFLDYLGVESVESDMTLSIQTKDGIEWGGENLKTIFAQRRNLLRPSFLRMLLDIVRFNRNAGENLRLSIKNNWTLGELVDFLKCNESFKNHYLLPMTGAIWSMSYENALKFPAETFLTFCINHRLLQINDRPIWRTIKGGSINYVNRVFDKLERVHLGTKVTAIRKKPNSIGVLTPNSEIDFDKVILATHAPTSKKIIQNDFPELAKEIACFDVTTNQVVLHGDRSVMPKTELCWSAWNVLAQGKANSNEEISLTYYINKLQPLNSKKNYFVTLNGKNDFASTHLKLHYDHPQFNFQAIEAQKRLPDIQGTEGIFFAGAWTRYGFHEDGILSAVNVAKLMGVVPPWI